MEFLPADDYVNSGEWNIILIPEQIVTGQYEMWLPVSYVLNEGTAFFYPTEERTLTIPSTSSRVLTVGAYDATAMTYADFSGRGKKTRTIRNPILPRPESMSSPSRDRAGTLLYRNLLCHTICGRRSGSFDGMGNDRKNDPFLYGEKAKAYLRRGRDSFRALKSGLTISSDTGRFVCGTASRRQGFRDCKHFLPGVFKHNA